MVYEISSDEVREKLLEFMRLDIISGINDPDTSAVEAARYSVLNKGHMWRPLLAVRAAQVFENTKYSVQRIIPSAAAIEYVHNATLMIDDVQDNSEMRRGQQSVWAKYGVSTANNTGFYLVGRAINTVANSIHLTASKRNKILSITGTAAMALVSGQQKDLAGKNGGEEGWRERIKSLFTGAPRVNPNVPQSLEEVIKMYEFKTGVLFSSAAMIGGVGHDASEEDIERLRNFGNFLGIAYQIGDDIYDCAGNSGEGGKPTGQDKGKIGVIDFEGLDGAMRLLKEYRDRALDLTTFLEGDGSHLAGFVNEMGDVMKKAIQ